MRKTILIVTTGTRDLQLKTDDYNFVENTEYLYQVPGSGERHIKVISHPDHHGTVLLSSMRDGCRQLDEDFQYLRQHIILPMITPAVKFVLERSETINTLLFIVTDQKKDSVSARFIHKDTVNFPPVAEQCLNVSFQGQIDSYDTYVCWTRLTDIDFWYEKFDKDLRNKIMIEENQGQSDVYFMAQGGLDQINQALTLRLIEYFPEINIIQIAEEKEPVMLEFPARFLQNLTRERQREAIEHFSFGRVQALNIAGDPVIKALTEVGHILMRLDHSSLVGLQSKEPFKSLARDSLILKTIFTNWVLEINPEKMNEWLYLTIKVNAFRGNTEEVLWRLSTLHEQLLKPVIAKWINWRKTSEGKPFLGFKRCIEKTDNLLQYLEQKGFKENSLTPGPVLYDQIANFFKKQNKLLPIELSKLNRILGNFKEERNTLIHQGVGVKLTELDRLLREKASIDSLDEFFTNYLDPYFKIKEFGILGELRDEILKRL